ncbi:MAG: S41 family peptidase, partial [Prevotellaceae bacterium]|nr:S41 family peptidase [Prevotellaceae bacterium]
MRKFIFTFFICLVGIVSFAQQKGEDINESYYKFARLLGYINMQYVDTVNIPKLTEKAVIEVLKNLDPHSAYVSKEDFKAANEPLEGNFEGVGVEFSILSDTLVVVASLFGGPSEKVGIQAGDRILAVDDKPIAGVGIKNEEIFKLLRGAKGTKVNLTIQRKGSKDLLSFVVTRDKIPIYSVDAAYEVRPGVGYVKLSRFASTSMREILESFEKFSSTPEALILDLRGNSGGILGISILLADQFLDEKKIIVYTEGTHTPELVEYSTKNGFYKTGKLVVLIDEGSASASEIVSGAIQDWDRGILIGRRTFGKGLVQQQLPLGDGSYIRLTIARYHTPTGRVIQRPYENGKIDKYYEDYAKRFSNGEFYGKDSIEFPDSLKYKTLVKERTVYGGGGIMPDIFVPYDTTSYSRYYGKLWRSNILNRFVLSFVDDNRKSLQADYPSFEEFNNKFVVADSMLERLIEFAEKEDLKRNEE